MFHLSVCRVVVLSLVAAEVLSDSPVCDPDHVAALKKTFSDPLPEDLLGETSKLGSWSVLTVAAPNLKQLKEKDESCISYEINKDEKTATSVRKMVPGALPQKVKIEEKDDTFTLTSQNDPNTSFTVNILYFKDGVALISKCCKDCKGDAINLALAVADKNKKETATVEAVIDVREKLKKLNLDVNLGDLVSCVEKEK